MRNVSPVSAQISDITRCGADAIVNAANESLLGGGGVDGAIHRAAGPKLLEECRRLRGCATGSAKITEGYNLPATHVIHTVGPIWQGGTAGESIALASCYKACLDLALKHELNSIAFPAISTGVYGYPIQAAADVAISSVMTWLETHSLAQVEFICFDATTLAAYEQRLASGLG